MKVDISIGKYAQKEKEVRKDGRGHIYPRMGQLAGMEGVPLGE